MPKPKIHLPGSIRRALEKQGLTVPQVAEMVGHFMQAAGGPQKLALLMYQEFLAAKQGSVIRQRILDSIIKMLTMANLSMGTVAESDMISDEDLEREAEQIVRGLPDAGESSDGQECRSGDAEATGGHPADHQSADPRP